MSQYDISDPRNPNSPYNMWNANSPFYNPKQASDQSLLDGPLWLLIIVYVVIPAFLLIVFFASK
jgi:hypothetical protein